MTTTGQEGRPLLHVVAGQATAEEVAALAAVVSALAARQRSGRSAAARQAAARRRPGWPDRAALMHAPLAPGPGAWPRSSRPR
jgi:hypothetical protein